MDVLLVDDSMLLRNIIKEVLNSDEELNVVAEASNGEMGVKYALEYNPDLIIMDLKMPIMDGIEATKEIMRHNPTPILIFSSEIDADSSFEAYRYGAVDIIKKPDIALLNDPYYYNGFINRLKGIARSKKETFRKLKEQRGVARPGGYRLLIIGASTGGPLAVKTILSRLPADFSLPVIVVQHMERGFDKGYADWLNSECELQVRLAKEVDSLKAGEVLVAPVDSHLIFRDDRVILDDSPPVQNQKPAVDVTFSSAAREYGRRSLAVLLTGMGRDGAEGAVELKKSGGCTLVQDQSSSAIFGMPKAAIELGGASEVLHLDNMAARILEITG